MTSLTGLRSASVKKGQIKMLRLMLMDTPVYIAALALGLIEIYRVRDYLIERQRRKDAEQASSEKERID